MPDIKEAYKILGVRENAGKDEIRKRYNIILRKYHMSKQGNSDTEIDLPDIDEVNKAYNLLMGYETEEKDDDAQPQVSDLILQKVGINKKKVKNFLYYYKLHIIAAIMVIVAAYFIIQSITSYVRPDLNLVFLGGFQPVETDAIKELVKENINNVKEPSVEVIPLSEATPANLSSAYRVKIVAVISNGDADVLILDKSNFEQYSRQGILKSLDDLVDSIGIDKEKNKDFITSTDSDSSPHLYGVDVSGSSIIKNSGIIGTEYIACLVKNGKNTGNAVDFIKLLLK